MLVIASGYFPIAFWWNDGRFSGLCQRFKHTLIGVIGLVGEDGVGRSVGKKDIRTI